MLDAQIMSESSPSHIDTLEALLFLYGEPLSLKKIASLLSVSAKEAADVVAGLRVRLQERPGALTLFEHEDTVQLTTKSEHASLLQALLKSELHEALTPAALETLSIIVYAGPISRAEIDYIRGVNSSYTVRALALRGLIDRETDPARGNSFVYRASAELMRHLGVRTMSELPDYERLRTVAKSVKPVEEKAEENGEKTKSETEKN